MTLLRAETVFRNTVELFRLISKTTQSPSALTSEYFQRKKHHTPDERRCISSLAFSALRNARLLSWLANECGFPKKRYSEVALLHIISEVLDLKFDEMLHKASLFVFSEAIQDEGCNASDIEMRAREKLENLNESVVTAIQNHDPDSLTLISTLTSMPQWILETCGIDDIDEVLQLGIAFQHDAPVCLRVELSRASRAELQTMLWDEGIITRNGFLSPAALVLDNRMNLSASDCYRNGLFEIQDEASQLVAYAISPRHNCRILDACAGAGGKTLHICDLMNDSGEIVATDTEGKRLSSLQYRTRKVGFTSIRAVPQTILHRNPARFGSFDAVLVDAPCSGIGTARRNPQLKHRLTPRMLERLTRKQYELIDRYSSFVKPGGILVYSTCSFLPQENEMIVQRFLENHQEFVQEDIGRVLAVHGIKFQTLKRSSSITLLPSVNQTDGFFIARMRKR